MKKILIISLVMVFALTLYAYQTNKPDTHNADWIKAHGQESIADPASCQGCHTDRVECIRCHQEVKPRSHNLSWKLKTHAFQARWDRSKCNVCHKEDMCVECHKSTPPVSHRPGWGGLDDSRNVHCGSCHYPIQETTCYTCHETSHSPQSYK